MRKRFVFVITLMTATVVYADPPAPAEGKNFIIVSHKPNLQDTAGKEFGDLSEGEVVVFKPLRNSKFKVVARVAPPETWSKWAK